MYQPSMWPTNCPSPDGLLGQIFYSSSCRFSLLTFQCLRFMQTTIALGFTLNLPPHSLSPASLSRTAVVVNPDALPASLLLRRCRSLLLLHHCALPPHTVSRPLPRYCCCCHTMHYCYVACCCCWCHTWTAAAAIPCSLRADPRHRQARWRTRCRCH